MSDNDTHVHVLTAFTVVVTPDGTAMAISDIPLNIVKEYEPNDSAIRRACHELLDDIAARAAALYTLQNLPKPEPVKTVRDTIADALSRRQATEQLVIDYSEVNGI